MRQPYLIPAVLAVTLALGFALPVRDAPGPLSAPTAASGFDLNQARSEG